MRLKAWFPVLFLPLVSMGQTPWKLLFTEAKDDVRLGSEGGLWKTASRKNAAGFGLVFREADGKLILQRIRKGLDTLLIRTEAIQLDSGWANHSHLVVKLEAPESDFTLRFGFQGPRGFSEEEFRLKKGIQSCQISLEALPFVTLPESWDRPSHIRFRFSGVGRTVSIHRIHLVRNPGFNPVRVDSFGQRKKGNWPGKVQKTEDLLSAGMESPFAEEQKEFSRFGGDLNSEKETPSGKFRVMKKANSWILVDPLGYPFWSHGVTGVRISVPGFKTPLTRVAGREALFEKLPPDSLRTGLNGELTQFYHWNVLRKYGNLPEWKAHTSKKLRLWGFNTLGNWSDPMWMKEPVIPYTYTLRTNQKSQFNLTSGLPDVFHPGWARWIDSAFSHIASHNRDSFLLGYFVDNEFHWQDLGKVQSDKGTYAFAVWQILKSRPHAVDSFRQSYAQRYFSVVSSTLKKYDPGHLYLGCRFLSRGKFPELARMAGEFCDVVSVNIYSADPEIARQWHQLTGKPILIGEFHIQLASDRQVPPLYPVFPEPDRSRMVKSYLEKCRSMPFLVGAHWYQYADQPVTGREGNGENQTIGLVDVCDTPYPELIRVFQEFASRKK